MSIFPKGFWKMRDLKDIIRKVRDLADDSGIIDKLEEFIEQEIIKMLIEEITEDPMYKALLRSTKERIKKEVED